MYFIMQNSRSLKEAFDLLLRCVTRSKISRHFAIQSKVQTRLMPLWEVGRINFSIASPVNKVVLGFLTDSVNCVLCDQLELEYVIALVLIL